MTHNQVEERKKSRFRFEAIWIRSAECERVIFVQWTGHEDKPANLMTWNKINKCRIGLIQWNKQSFGHVQHRMRAIDQELIQLRQEVITNSSWLVKQKLKAELEELKDMEEMFWKQHGKS